MARKTELAPLTTASGLFLLYLATYSGFHNFDGVACAIAVELGDVRHLAHGNHVLYGLAGLSFHRLLQLAGLKLSALDALQLLDSLLGAASVGLFHAGVLRLGFSPRLGALAAIGLGVSYGFWLWSLEAQVYILGALFLILALLEGAREPPDERRLALWHGAAMLAHGANALFAPAAVWLLWRPASDRIRRLARYAAWSGAMVLAGYACAACLFVRPRGWDELRVWLLGSMALTADRSFLWHGGWSLGNLREWLRLCGEVVSPAAWISAPLWGWALWEAWLGRRERLTRACLLWLAAYACLFVSWEPFTMVYRVSDLIPLWLLLALAAARAETRRPLPAGKAALALGVLALCWTNWRGIASKTDPASNIDLQESLWIRRTTPESSWIAIDGVGQVYVPYFAHRRPLNLRYFAGREAALDARLAALRLAGEPVYVPSEMLPLPWDWGRFFGRYRLSQESRLDDRTLLLVGPLQTTGQPKGKR